MLKKERSVISAKMPKANVLTPLRKQFMKNPSVTEAEQRDDGDQ